MEKETSNSKKSLMKTLFVAGLGIISFIYIINPTAGILELIPDNFPLIGNLDEAAAVAIIIASIRYFGFDVSNFLSGKNQNKINLKKKDD